MLRMWDQVFQIVPIFYKNHMTMSSHGNQIEDIGPSSNFAAKNVLLAYQMEQNGTFL